MRNVAVGDRILAVCVSACDYCRFCTSGLYGQCLNGGWALGNTIDGVQAEYARIPFARNVVVVDRVAGPRDIALPRADGYDLAGAPLGVLESVFVSSSLTPGVNSVMSYRWRRAP